MIKIYAPPKSLPYKSSSYSAEYDTEYTASVQKYCRDYGAGSLKGEIVRFPYADGYAEYVVFSLRPCTLIHLPIGDAWSYPYINRLTTADIRAKIKQQKILQALFK